MARADLLLSNDAQGAMRVSGGVLNLPKEQSTPSGKVLVEYAVGLGALALPLVACKATAFAPPLEVSPAGIVSPAPQEEALIPDDIIVTPAYLPPSTKEAPTAVSSPLSPFGGLYYGIDARGNSTFAVDGDSFEKQVAGCTVPIVDGAHESQLNVFFNPAKNPDLASAIGVDQNWFLKVLKKTSGIRNAHIENGVAIAEDASGKPITFDTIIKSEPGKPFGNPVICFAGDQTLDNLRIGIWDDRAQGLVANTKLARVVISPAELAAQSGLTSAEVASVTKVEFDQATGRHILMDANNNDLAAVDAMGASKTEVFIQGLVEKNVGVPPTAFVEQMKSDAVAELGVSADMVNIGYTDRKNDGTQATDIKGNPIIFAVDQTTGTLRAILVKNKESGEWGEWEKATMGNVGDLLGINIGTNLSSPSRKNDFGQEVATKVDNLVVSNYNLAIVEAAGWVWTEKSYNQFDWSRMDAAVKLASENGMKIQGDNLIYGYSNQKWTYLKESFNYKGEQVNLYDLHETDPDKAKQILTDVMVNHISQTIGRYKGQVQEWKVVNEIGTEEGKDIFMDIIGPEYVKIAFRAARAADPDAKLILNDDKSDTMSGEKYAMIKGIVDDLKSEGLIDAIGLQMHIDATNPPSKEDLIKGFKSWGIPVILSELDINLKDVGGTDEERFQKQAEIGVMIFQALNESGVGDGYGLWDGLGDQYSWLENPKKRNQPKADGTPFFDNGLPKQWVHSLLKEMMSKLLN